MYQGKCSDLCTRCAQKQHNLKKGIQKLHEDKLLAWSRDEKELITNTTLYYGI